MKFINGLWHYRGRTYTTLRAALLAAGLLPRRPMRRDQQTKSLGEERSGEPWGRKRATPAALD